MISCGIPGRSSVARPGMIDVAQTAHHMIHSDKYKRAFFLLAIQPAEHYSAYGK
jgi:hypothetical protein